VELLCEPVGGEAEGFHELREKDFTGVDGEGVRDIVHGLVSARHKALDRQSRPFAITYRAAPDTH